MKETRIPFSEVLSDEQIRNLYAKCNYDENDRDLIFNCGDFINGLSLITYGCVYDIHSDVINVNGDFVEILLDGNIKYSNGEIVKLKNKDKGSYFFEISRVLEKKYENEKFSSSQETEYFAVKVERHPNNSEEDALDIYYVINSQLDVIATFKNTNTTGKEFDGYENCNIYTERDFYFISEDREFMVFSQRLMAESEEKGFYDKHLTGLCPMAYEDSNMRDCDQDLLCGDNDYMESYGGNIDEEDLDEETMQLVIKKYNGELEEIYNEYDYLPDVEDIDFFFESTTNALYKDVFKEFYKTLYGIIDCKIKSSKQLLPFTDNKHKVHLIIEDRCAQEIKDGQSPLLGARMELEL